MTLLASLLSCLRRKDDVEKQLPLDQTPKFSVFERMDLYLGKVTLRPSSRLSDHGQLSQVLDVADRRIAKMAFVLAAEVRCVVVTDLKACLGRVETFGEHGPPRLLQAEFLLKLQGAHGCNGFEVGMKAGDAHANLARDFLNAKRLGEILAQLSDSPNHAMGVAPPIVARWRMRWPWFFAPGIWRGSRPSLFFQPFADRLRILPEIQNG